MNDTFRRPKRDDAPRIGGDIDAWCGRCKRESGHTVTALVSGVPVQVKCGACNAIHKFRPMKEAKPTRRTKKAVAEASEITVYHRLMTDRDPTEAIVYSVFRRPVANELMKHKKFGLGVVHKVGVDKAEVYFLGGKKSVMVSR